MYYGGLCVLLKRDDGNCVNPQTSDSFRYINGPFYDISKINLKRFNKSASIIVYSKVYCYQYIVDNLHVRGSVFSTARNIVETLAPVLARNLKPKLLFSILTRFCPIE